MDSIKFLTATVLVAALSIPTIANSSSVPKNNGILGNVKL